MHWGIREHGMAAACNGLSLHGGIIPSGASFLIFTDYCRPSLRLAALMGIRVCHAFTHDSIGLGEDGPTHQPVEQIASLRAMPNMYLYRPADSVETVECWQSALERRRSPSIIALTRQSLPALRRAHVAENLSARGRTKFLPASAPARGVDLRLRIGGLARGRRANAARRPMGSRPAWSRCRAWTRSSSSRRIIAAR